MRYLFFITNSQSNENTGCPVLLYTLRISEAHGAQCKFPVNNCRICLTIIPKLQFFTGK